MASIIAPLEGCVNIGDLDGDLIWYVIGPDRHKAGAWQTDKPGCDATTHRQRELIIDGGTASLRNLDDGQVLAIRFDYGHWDQCGRFQIDVTNAVTGEQKALVINANVVCEAPPKPPVRPPVRPPVIPPYVPPYTEVPPLLPPTQEVPPTPIPEPGTMLLLSGALLARAVWQKLKL